MKSVGKAERSPARVAAAASLAPMGTWPAHPALLAMALMLMTVLAYVPAMCGGFVWDDDSYITTNPVLRSAGGLGRIWFEIGATPQYYPMVFTSYWVEYRLWGLNPAGYHMVNVLLHGVSAVLLWRVLAGLRVPGGWVAAAIFALHPVHVESVAWVTERKNVLCGVFYLAAALMYLRFALEPGKAAPRSVRLRWYTVAFILLAGALFSKTVTASLPAALLLVLWWKRGRLRPSDVYPLLPFFAVAMALGPVTAWLERHHVGAIGKEWDFSAVDRCLIAGRAMWFYAGKLAWPEPLIFFYPRWQIDASAWWQYLFPAALAAVVAALWLARQRLGRGPLVATLFFVGTLLPASGFFNVYPMRFSFVADHFQYLASIGLITLAVGMGTTLAARLGVRGQRMAPVVVACVLAAFGAQAWRQEQAYANLEALWRDTVGKNSTAWMAQYNLGNLLSGRGELDEAIQHYREALRHKPDDPDTNNNLGLALADAGKPDEAAGYYEEVLKLMPQSAAAHNNLGLVLADKGRFDDAIRHYNEAIRIEPGFPEAYNNIGMALAKQGKLKEALPFYHEAIRQKPAFPEAYGNLGNALVDAGQWEEALQSYRKAIELAPNLIGGHKNAALVLEHLGRPDQAAGEYREVLRLNPQDADAREQLDRVLARQAGISGK